MNSVDEIESLKESVANGLARITERGAALAALEGDEAEHEGGEQLLDEEQEEEEADDAAPASGASTAEKDKESPA